MLRNLVPRRRDILRAIVASGNRGNDGTAVALAARSHTFAAGKDERSRPLAVHLAAPLAQ